jgi:hypothetical protein
MATDFDPFRLAIWVIDCWLSTSDCSFSSPNKFVQFFQFVGVQFSSGKRPHTL